MIKILCVVDRYNWALDIEMQGLKKYLRPEYGYEIDIRTMSAVIRSDKDAILKQYDFIFPVVHEIVGTALINADYPKSRMFTCTMSHRFYDKGKSRPGIFPKIPDTYLEKCKGYRAFAAVNQFLVSTYKKQNFPVMFCIPGTDPEKMLPLPRKLDKSAKLRIGWAGRPTTVGKGYYDYIVPVAIKLYDQVELRTACYGEDSYVPPEAMRYFYRDIDVLLIMADSEGAPDTMREALACGRPTITVNIGLAPQFIVNNYNGFIIYQAHQALEDAIMKYVNDRDLLILHWKNTITNCKLFSWENVMHMWIDFFDAGVRGDGLLGEGYAKK